MNGEREPRFVFHTETPRFYQARGVAGGKVLLAADTDTQATLEGPLTRLGQSGRVDRSFVLDPSIKDSQVRRASDTNLPRKIAAGHQVLAVQPDGKIIVTFLAFDEMIHLARLQPDGAIDPTFLRTSLPARHLALTFPMIHDRFTGVTLQPQEGVLTATLSLRGTVVQADGRIVVVGSFTSFAGVAARGVIRLHPDGAVDKSFDTGGGAQWTETVEAGEFFPVVQSIAQQNDGKLLLAGTFEAFNGTPAPGSVSLNEDGSVDQTATALPLRDKYSWQATRLKRQPNGSFLLSGPYGFPGETAPAFLRILHLGGVPIIGSSDIATAFPGRAFSYQIVASGQPTSYGATGLPAGFSFDPATGLITSLPTAAQSGAYAVELTATNDLGTSSERVLQLTIVAPVPVESVVSRLSHGSAGIFDIPLPLTGNPGVECRTVGGGYRTIVFRFTHPMASARSVTVSGGGTVSETWLNPADPRELTVRLWNVPNAREITLTLQDLSDVAGNFSAEVAVRMVVLIGDTNGNGVVNASDVGQTKALSGQAVTQASFRADVNASGAINASDITVVKANSGSQVQTDTEVSSRTAR